MLSRQAELILAQFPSGEPGTIVDVGANDGIFNSNTIGLEKLGWDCLCIEANPLYAPDLWVNRPYSVIGAVGTHFPSPTKFYVYETVWGMASKSGLREQPIPEAVNPLPYRPAHTILTPVRTLDWYLDHSRFSALSVLCLDIEGTEEDALDGFDISRWRPKVICVENWPQDDRFQRRLSNYTLIGRVDFDEIFVRNG